MEDRNLQTAFVYGGAGFIGSHLCDRLLASGKNVVCIDNLSSGRLENISHLLINKHFRFVEDDIVNVQNFECPIHEIYNLACPASPILYQRDPIHTLKTSVLGTVNVLELASLKKAKVLLASTSEVYGNPLVPVQDENYWGNVNSNGVRSCYDEGKRAAETLFCDYHRQRNVDIRIVRIFNTYGPRMSPWDGRAIPNFIEQALTGKDFTVYGDGSQTRSFMYVDDLLDGINKLMVIPVCGPVNIGNPEEVSILNLVELIRTLTHSSSRIVYMSLPKDDPIRRHPDISLALQVLKGWKPSVGLEKGLIPTIRYFINLKHNKNETE